MGQCCSSENGNGLGEMKSQLASQMDNESTSGMECETVPGKQWPAKLDDGVRLSKLKMERGPPVKFYVDEKRIKATIMEKVTMRKEVAKFGTGGLVAGKINEKMSLSETPLKSALIASASQGEGTSKVPTSASIASLPSKTALSSRNSLCGTLKSSHIATSKGSTTSGVTSKGSSCITSKGSNCATSKSSACQVSKSSLCGTSKHASGQHLKSSASASSNGSIISKSNFEMKKSDVKVVGPKKK